MKHWDEALSFARKVASYVKGVAEPSFGEDAALQLAEFIGYVYQRAIQQVLLGDPVQTALQLTIVQTRCTELLEETRTLHKAVEQWEDVPDKWNEAIHAAHPTRSESHDQWGMAMEMVGHRHSKGELVSLVNWLLLRAHVAEEACDHQGHTTFSAGEGVGRVAWCNACGASRCEQKEHHGAPWKWSKWQQPRGR